MSVDYWLVFVVCQAAFVQPDGITLPFTFLTYKSVPASPKEDLLSFENAETPTKTIDVKRIEIVDSPKTPLQSPLQQPLLKSIIPTNSKNVHFKTVSNSSPSPPLDVQTKSTKRIESPIKIQNSSPNIATTQVSKLTPNNLLNEGSNIIKDDLISNNYSPKVGTFTNNLANYQNNDVVNLESSLNIGLSDVPCSTNKANQANIQQKYLDRDKQLYLQFEKKSLNPVIQKLEETKFVPDWENIQKDNLNKIKDNIAGSDVLDNLLQEVSSQKCIDKNISRNENVKLIEKSNTINKVLCPVDNIVFSSGSLTDSNPEINAIQPESKGDKIYTKSNLASIENTLDLTVRPSVKFGSNKLNAMPCNVEISDYDNINNVANAKPVCPLNYVPSQTPSLGTYSYGAKEMPKVYLPNGYTNPTKIATSPPGSYVSPASSLMYKVSDTYNCVKDETLPDTVTKSSVNFNPNNYVMSKYLVGTDSLTNISPISTYHTAPSYYTKVPVLVQLPDVYTPEITLSQPLSSHVVSNPSNAIFDDVPDTACVNSLNNRLPKSIRPDVDHTMLYSSEKLNLLVPLFGNIDNIPPYQPKCINQNNAIPSTYVFTPVKSNQAVLQPPEYECPVTLPLSPAKKPCPSTKLCSSNPKLTKTNLYSSPLTESLNNVISYLTTGLLSAFFDSNTKSDGVISPISIDCPIIDSVQSNVPSSIYSETSVSVAMPIFMLNSPQLPSPTSLPIPNVVLPLKDSDNKSSLKRKSVIKKPKAYISSITINLIPSNDVNDMIVFV